MNDLQPNANIIGSANNISNNTKQIPFVSLNENSNNFMQKTDLVNLNENYLGLEMDSNSKSVLSNTSQSQDANSLL